MSYPIAVLKQFRPNDTFLVDQNGARMRQASLKMEPVFLDNPAARIRQNWKRHFVSVTELFKNLDRVITDSHNLDAGFFQ